MKEKRTIGWPLWDRFIFQKNRYSLCLFLFVLALLIRLFFFFFLFLPEPLIFGKYPYFANQINHGVDIGERLLDLSPLYLYGMVLFQKIFGSHWEIMLLFQFVMGSVTAIIIFFLGERVFRRSVGILAALLYIFYGNLILFEMTLEPETFVIFLNALFVFAVTMLGDEVEPNRTYNDIKWLGIGMLLGLSAITKANALIFIPASFVWIFIIYSGIKKKARYAFFFLVGTLLIIVPITMRNYVKFNDKVLITADMGKVFFHGNGPGATGMERADLPDQGFLEERASEPDSAHALFRQTARRLVSNDLPPSACSRFWMKKAFEYMSENSKKAFLLFVKKAIFFWLSYEVHDLDSNYFYYQTISKWPIIPYGLISALGILGILLSIRRLKRIYWLLMFVLGYWITVIIFFDASRYRLPGVPFLVVFSAYGLTVIFESFRQRNVLKGVMLAIFATALLWITFFSFRKEIHALDLWQQATRIHYNVKGNGHFRRGDYLPAIREYQMALIFAPDFAPAWNQLGKAHALLGDWENAEKCFLKVIELSPSIDQGYLNLGLLHHLRGNSQQALFYLKKALFLNPQNPKITEYIKEIEEKNRHR